MKNQVLILFFATILLGCKSPEKSNTMSTDQPTSYDLPKWAKSANIYEVNIRQFTPEGTLNAFAAHLPRLKEMGVDILWLMPVYPISTTKKKGSLGSYYSVSNFKAINPEFGTMKDMESLISKIHELDMKIILDWVPNHTGWDHQWLVKHKNWYSTDKDGNVTDPRNPVTNESYGWTDVADLNYDSEEMRAEMLSQLVWWVEKKNIDGYRMDIAFGVPNDFWDEVKQRLFKTKPLYMLAESEEAYHRNSNSFHSTYGWNLFHCMNAIAKGEKTTEEFKAIHRENAEKFEFGTTLNFTSNHDENAWNGTEKERLGAGHKGWAVVMALLDGMPLIYCGMEEPLERRLEFFEKDDIKFQDFEYQDFYKNLWKIKDENEALWNAPYGATARWIETGSEILAFTRELNGNTVSVFFNTSDKTIPYSSELIKSRNAFTNEMIKEDYEFKAYDYLVVTNK